MLAFERHTGCLLAARLRPGNASSHGRIVRAATSGASFAVRHGAVPKTTQPGVPAKAELSCSPGSASLEIWELLGWPDKKPDCPPSCERSVPLSRGFQAHVAPRRRWHLLRVRFGACRRIDRRGHRAGPG